MAKKREMEFIREYYNEEGKHVREYKDGKRLVIATYMNKLSDKAIRNANRYYNEHIEVFNSFTKHKQKEE